MNSKTLWAVVVGVVVIIVAGYLLTHQESPRKSVSVIKIGSFSTAIDYAPYLVAKNKKWFEDVAQKYGAKVEYTAFQSLPPINEALATKNIDLVFYAEAPAIVGKAAGIDVKIIGAGAFLEQEVIVPTNSTATSIKDLKGKKIAVLAGTSAHQGLMKILAANGLSATDVQIIDMIPPDAKAAFETGKVDAWSVWPPFPQQEQIAGKGKPLSGSQVFIQSIVATRGDVLKDNPQLAKDLMDVVRKAQDYIVKNPTDAEEIVAQELGLPLDVVKLAWPKHDFQPTLGTKEKNDIQEKADFLQSIGLIKNKVQASSLIDLR